ncbi:ral guanine nucleotide dissociation stimulator-like 1, partial [Oncorhynchus keta]|uniref:ral guanine nucleotide dissociation stimulator-like 1 n=1 Tax=Oncorhynchus keta TaxID=8018 RepID=UPI00227D1959
MRMRSTLSLCGGEGEGRGLRARVGRMKRLLCLRHTHRVDVLSDMEPGLWLRRFQLLDTDVTEDPVQEWGEEVEEGAVFGITLCREPVLPSPSTQVPSEPLTMSLSTPSAFNFIQYHTVKVRRLKAGTLERLVTHLLDSEHQESDYVRVFLSTYRTFTTSNTLIELLFQRDDMIANLDNTVCPRSTLVPLIRTWLEEHREDFRNP